ncbi:MAG: hypothetical protein NVSMB48_12700 [Marmoricola sp.]
MLALIAVLIVLLIVLAIAGWALWLLLSAALVGAIIGGLARLVLPGRQDISIFATVLLGWIGSLVGSLFGRHVFHVGSLLTILCEIGAAAILVGIASSTQGRSLTRS